MNRLQKKCFFASAAIHGLLLALLFVSPAFLPKQEKFENLQLITLIPDRLTDDPFSGGGAQNPAPPATVEKVEPAPAPPVETPRPAVIPEPEPVKPEPAPVTKKPEPKPEPLEPKPQKAAQPTPQPKKSEPVAKAKPEAPDPPAKKTPARITPSFERATNVTLARRSSSTSEADAARARAQAQQRLVGQIVQRLNQGLSGGTEIGIPGPGSEAYMNYGLAIRAIFDAAWQPGDIAENNSTVTALVTILRDGTVSGYQIERRSGNAALDRSVIRALESVSKVPPFPLGAKEDKRDFRIHFNLKAKRQAE